MKATKIPQVALKLPKIIALLIVFIQHVMQSMNNSPWFTSLAALLAQTATDLAAFQAAQANALGRGNGTAEARDLKKKAAVDDLLLLKSGVVTLMNQNPLQAAAILAASGMFERRHPALEAEPRRPHGGRGPRRGDRAGEGRQGCLL